MHSPVNPHVPGVPRENLTAFSWWCRLCWTIELQCLSLLWFARSIIIITCINFIICCTWRWCVYYVRHGLARAGLSILRRWWTQVASSGNVRVNIHYRVMHNSVHLVLKTRTIWLQVLVFKVTITYVSLNIMATPYVFTFLVSKNSRTPFL